MNLGRLKKVELRDRALIPAFSQRDEGDVAQDFTPWLAKEEENERI